MSEAAKCCSAVATNNSKLLIYDRHNTKPGDFQADGADIKFRGIYEIYKKDGSKITVSRRYTDIEQFDKQIIPFCREIPNW